MPTLLVAVSCSLAILALGAGMALGALLPDIAREFHQRPEITGVLIGLTFTGSLVGMPVIGYLSDRFGKKPLFLIVLTGMGLAYALTMVAPSFAIVALACILSGSTGTMVEGLSAAMIFDLDPRHADRNLTLLQVAYAIGMLLSLGVSIWLGRIGIGWRGVYGMMAAVTALAWLPALAMRVPPAPPGEPISLPIARRVISDRFVQLMALGVALYVAVEISVTAGIRPMLARQGLPPAAGLFGVALFWVGIGLLRVGTSLLARRVSPMRILGWLIAAGLVALAMLIHPFAPWVLWAGIALAGLAFSSVWPLLVHLGSARHPAYSGTATAVMVASGTAGAIVVPTFASYLINRYSPTLGFSLLFGLYALLALAVWVGRRGSL